ncbi:MAG TPA: DUF1634 domain-containing protein [Bryobacteraceae bacterium]|jgi:uncharacterized membrane protein|nr:DUF1634 domain-containing protein [Bryobacteraceae bacterium]
MDSGQKMETQMGLLLRTGVLASCLIMCAGAVLYLLRHGEQQESFAAFHGQPPEFETPGGIWQAARHGSARGIIQLSVLVLIATPVMRVVFAVFAFARQKQWIFSFVSLVVLALLAYGLFLSG